MSQRIVCWFSHGAASTIAAKLAIEINNQSESPKELIVMSIYLKEEHEDNARYLKDCEKYLGQKIETITSEKYKSSVDEVIRREKYMSGPYGARCTRELKKQVRWDWQRSDDIHVFGFTSEEQLRSDDLLQSELGLQTWCTLIDAGLSKQDCFAILECEGIRLPEMYHLGYNNNNCIGCLKASSVGYWNKIRIDFPEVFWKRSGEEKSLNVAMCEMSANKFAKLYPEYFIKMLQDTITGELKNIKIKSSGSLRIPLRYLPPDAGKHEPIYVPDCGFFCL